MEVAKHRIPTGSLVEIIETGVRLYVVQRYYAGGGGKPYEPRYLLHHKQSYTKDDAPPRKPYTARLYAAIPHFTEDDLMVIERPEDHVNQEGYTGGVVSHDVNTHWLGKYWAGEPMEPYRDSAVALIVDKDDSPALLLANMHMFMPFSWVHSLATVHWENKRLFTLFFNKAAMLERIEETPDVKQLWKDPVGTMTIEDLTP